VSVEKLAHQIVEFYEKLSSWEHEVVREDKLTLGQMHAIEIIGHQRSLRMRELAEKLGVTTGTLTVMVDRLERLGMIERRPHETDRRSFLVVLTEAGEKHFARHHQYHLKLTEELFAGLSPQEVETFEQLLDKVIAQL
jgi:DNA-binding MarR family transcriptional regulator